MRKLFIVLIILFVVIYFIYPFDIFPDFFGLPGRIDDISLIGLAIWFIRKRLLRNTQRFKNSFWQKSSMGNGFRQGQNGGRGQQYNYKYSGNKENEKKKTAQGARESSSDPYVILNVSRNATEDEIKKAYKELLKKYHPDKVAFLGEDFQKIAHTKMVEIQRAYDTLISK